MRRPLNMQYPPHDPRRYAGTYGGYLPDPRTKMPRWLWRLRYALRMWAVVNLPVWGRGAGYSMSATAWEERDFFDSPEEAADEEISNWTD